MAAPKRDRLLTAQDVADLSTFDIKTIYSRRLRGERPHGFHLGSRLVFRESEVLDWIDECERVENERWSR